MNLTVQFTTVSCCYDGCGITVAMPKDYYRRVCDSHNWWYCLNGHRQHFTGTSDAEKLRRAEAQLTAQQDQLAAAIRDAESVRVALLRDRQRFANGVCPCCNRSFDNVRRHMETKHPDYDATKVVQHRAPQYPCSCGRKFETLQGLRIHQGAQRREGWDSPSTSRWFSHLTKV